MPPTDTAGKDARLNLRLTTGALDTIKEAASLQQQDVTSFVLGAALDRARSVLAEERMLRLSPHDLAHLEAMLDREPEAVPQLAALLTRVDNPAHPSPGRGERI